MNGKLQDRVAIVTGTGRGIGKATALAFAREGATVFCVDIDAGTGEVSAAEASADGRAVRFVQGDVSSEDDVRAIVRQVLDEHRRVDIMVNNAVCQIEARAAAVTVADFHRQVNVNFLGCALFCREVIPSMVAQGRGAIVNLSSVNAFALDPVVPIYGGTKAAIIAYTKSVAVAYGPQGIRANAICPGDVDTPLNQAFWARLPDPAGFRVSLDAMYPLRRIAAPEEIAEIAVFLASDAASFISGAAIVADGGITSRIFEV